MFHNQLLLLNNTVTLIEIIEAKDISYRQSMMMMVINK